MMIFLFHRRSRAFETDISGIIASDLGYWGRIWEDGIGFVILNDLIFVILNEVTHSVLRNSNSQYECV